jgi:DNA-nicking Smr family endonuclease
MVSDRIYELCQPVLDDDDLGDEEKTDKLEEVLSSEPASLKGKALEDAVLGALWRWKGAKDKTTSPQTMRGANLIRSRSPAPWLQRSGTPSNAGSPRPRNATPGPPPGLGPQPPALARTMSSTASPFTSPRPSPRLPVSTPAIPHSPRLSVYQFSDSAPTTENYGDYGSDNVDWLVNDETSSNTSYGDMGMGGSEYMQPYTTDMSPYDMLRSILQDNRSDDELERILEANGYDLSQTINFLMEAQDPNTTAAAIAAQDQQNRTYLIGKSMSPSSRPMTPVGQQKSPIVCRYWLQAGHCARADCRFSHSLENHVCKFWLQGNCLAGSLCQFSHDPVAMMQQLSLTSSNSEVGTPQQTPPNLQLQDYDSFPSLQPQTSNPYEDADPLVDPQTISAVLLQNQQAFAAAPPGLFPNFVPTGPRNPSLPGSRPGSRHTSRAPTPGSQPNFNDDEAFPSLGSAAANRPGKRHHGKRGGHGHHTNVSVAPQPSSLADVVRMSPSPAPSGPKTREAMRRGLQNNRSFTSTRENGNAALSIPAPEDVPWLETGENVNRAYLKARSDAVRHGGLRNKFLQSAAQAWNRNDARGAKALSLRGQNENALMREAHREAARVLYAERNKQLSDGRQRELYVDLHGLHAEEAVSYLTECLQEHKSSSRPVYAITGTGHHSKNGKDKVGKAVRQYLTEWRYAFREFSVPGDRNNVGGILGINPSSYDKELAKKGGPVALGGGDGDSGIDLTEGKREDTKVVLAKEDPRKAARADSHDDDDEVLEGGGF